MRKRVPAFCLALLMLLGCLSFPALAANSGGSGETVRIGMVEFKGYASQDSSGSDTGVNAEYAYKIAQYADLQIEIVLVNSNQEGFDLLDSGAIDMMCDVTQTGERAEKYLFSESSVGSIPMCAFTRQDDDRYTYDNVRQLSAMTFGAEEGSRVAELFTQWCALRGITPTIRTYPGLEEIESAVDTGEVDAGLYRTAAVDGYRTIQTFATLPYYFVFRQDGEALKTKVDGAMEDILAEDPLYFDKLVQKYTSSIEYEMEALTEEEQAYVAEHPEIRVAVLENDQPYYSTGKNGKAEGVIPDFYTKLAALTGFRFTYQVYTAQTEAVDAVKDGQADVLGMYSDGQIPAYNSGLRLTRAYSNVDTVLITRTGINIGDVDSVAVKNRSRNAVQNSVGGLLDADYVGYDNARECFAALRSGQVDAMLCGLPSATWLINQNLSSAYTIQTLTSGSLELCGATAYGSSTLCSILSKGISASFYSFNETVTNNTLPENSWESTVSRIPPVRLAVLTAALFLLVLVLVWALVSLQHRHKEKAAVMAQAAENERRKSEIAAREKATDEKNRFFSNISHDMRTPLNAIIGFSNLAQEKADTEEMREYLRKIQMSGNLLLALINDTLTISKANSGKLKLHLEAVSCRETFDSVVIPIRQAAEKKHIRFTVDSTDTAPRIILTDKLNLQKILLNLLANAVKYTPEGGHVELVVRDEPGADGQDPETVIRVRDSGIGMSPEFLQHLYEPFVQEQRSGYESSGTGLGLSIVKELVELMGGTIAVTSEEGKGTEFTVRLRLRTARGSGKPDGAPGKEPGTLRGKRILLCEDNALNRELACALLREKGAEVAQAENGEKGVDLFAASMPGEFAAILMDLRMPVMDGCSAAQAIRALSRPDAKTVPILAMTADAFQDDVERCRSSGMNGHLSKPIEPELFYRTLERAVGE